MKFPEEYKILSQNSFVCGEYKIVPIRYEDRFNIMEWRNEQLYHLRQKQPLTKEDQENYFANVVAKLFDEKTPDQLLFSYLHDDECIGYGGLVHINWTDNNAEISFIMKTELEKNEFKKHWGIYLNLIERVAFHELKLHKIYTYAFDLRPHLYDALEANNYLKEAVLKDHCLFNGTYRDVLIHSKINDTLNLRMMEVNDEEILFKWANDPLNRNNSFNSKSITIESHKEWFNSKLKDKNAYYFICEVGNIPAGLVRFDYDLNKKAYIIGITLAKNYRGRKLSATFLKKACENVLKTTNSKILAYIKEENIPSRKAFEGAGFKFYSKEIVKNNESLKYVYEN